MKLLEGKKAVVAGVANKRSIAWGIARAFHEHGAEVAFTCVGRVHKRVAKLAAEIGSDIVVDCDVLNDGDIERAFGEVGAAFGGKLDVLVHSIAYANLDDMGGEFMKVSRAGWNLALEVSAYSLVAMARAARPLMIAAGGGSIMTLSFMGGDRVVPSYNIMGVAKAALEATTRYLAYDLGPDKIRVNALSPGPIPTMSSMVVDQFNVALEQSRRHCPLLRNPTPEEVGDAAVYFASDMSSVITASAVHLDGGLYSLAAPGIPHPRADAAPPAEQAD